MKNKTGRVTEKLKGDLFLLTAALIWGLAFVAQRKGMEYVTPFFFNGMRFMLGALILLPLTGIRFSKAELLSGIKLGTVLFIAASLQQVGIVSTTAGKAGFITGLYVIFVPILGVYSGESASIRTWSGVIMAVTGLYLLSFTDNENIAWGDMLVLLSAVFFALHVRLVGAEGYKYSPYKLAFLQYTIVSILSIALWLLFEPQGSKAWKSSLVPLLYGGILSIGLAYTLQIFGQRKAKAADSAIILCMEGAFAGIGGYLILNEQFTGRMLAGSILMITGAILAGLPEKKTEVLNAE